MAFVEYRFELLPKTEDIIRSMTPKFGYDGFGELTFYRTYSREKEGRQENWADCVLRVTNGTFSIRKDWYIRNHITWDEEYWQSFAKKFAIAMFKMWWLPPGRGLWAMGTDFVYQRGSIALQNCGFTLIEKEFGDDINWLMDSLMCGVGVGFEAIREDDLELYEPGGVYDFIIPDTREGWCDSVKALIDSYRYPYMKKPKFVYDKIRPAGTKIKGFGGICSGYKSLEYYHQQIETYCHYYLGDMQNYDSVLLKNDLANGAGCCVVSGNVRRSAELSQGKITDQTFLNLKDYDIYPHRENIGWMANCSVILENDSDFEMMEEISQRVIKNGEPGYINKQNLPYARIDKKMKGLRKDKAIGFNPCQPAFSKILTKQGIRQFKDIQIEDIIWSEYGWTKVLNKWSTGIKPIYKYQTTANIFYGTENHRIVSNYFKIEVGKASSIDVLAGEYKENIERDQQAIIDGLVIGDGTKQNNKILLCIGEKDQDYFKSSIQYFIHDHYNKAYEYRVMTTITLDELPNIYLRVIPDRFIYANRDIVASFLRGLYSANGSICGNRVTLKATSFKLIEQVQLMLSSIGIRSYWTKNKLKDVEFNNGIYTCKESYDLNISNDRIKFANIIGFIQSHKMQALQDLIDRMYKSIYANKGNIKNSYDIISIEYLGEEEVFDITVEQDTHTYWTQGCNVSNCGEQPLENKELCCLAETFPTVCENETEWYKACEYANFYAQTVTLLPTHQPTTNRIIAKNRRIGISISDFTGWKYYEGLNKVIKYMRHGYKLIRKCNKKLAAEAGVPESIRITNVKPGGTVPKLPGKTPGAGYPTFKETLRRIRIQQDTPFHKILIDANIPYEKDYYSMNTDVFSYPIIQGPALPAYEISVWEQAFNLITLQREWADNAVSNTLYFRPKWPLIKKFDSYDYLTQIYIEGLTTEVKQWNDINQKIENAEHKEEILFDDYKIIVYRTKDWDFKEIKIFKYDPKHEEDCLEAVMTHIAPLTKSATFLPHSPKGAYVQMPEEGLTYEEYQELKARIKNIDWSSYRGSDGIDEKYCDNQSCIGISK